MSVQLYLDRHLSPCCKARPNAVVYSVPAFCSFSEPDESGLAEDDADTEANWDGLMPDEDPAGRLLVLCSKCGADYDIVPEEGEGAL